MCYVDDNKVSHMEVKLVENLINDTKKHFKELFVTIGNKHEFLVININNTEDKKVEI